MPASPRHCAARGRPRRPARRGRGEEFGWVASSCSGACSATQWPASARTTPWTSSATSCTASAGASRAAGAADQALTDVVQNLYDWCPHQSRQHMSTRHINPPRGLHRSPAFSQAIVVPLRRFRAGELRWRGFYELKAGPAGGRQSPAEERSTGPSCAPVPRRRPRSAEPHRTAT
jgi:hypothetical protein